MASPSNILCCPSVPAKEMVAGPVQCSGCGDRYQHTRHGCYERYVPDGNERVAVQRYRCRNASCSCVTFSILPFPCLRYKRHTLATFVRLAMLAIMNSVARLARLYGKGWTAMRRMIWASRNVWTYFNSERRHQSWGPCPCVAPSLFWTMFTQALSYATVPDPGPNAKNT